MPQAPSPIETAPKTMRTTLAAMPPYLKMSLMATPFSVVFMSLSLGELAFTRHRWQTVVLMRDCRNASL